HFSPPGVYLLRVSRCAAFPPLRPISAMCWRSRLTFSPPLRPASAASPSFHLCAVPRWWAALPPLLAIARPSSGSIAAKPRSRRSAMTFLLWAIELFQANQMPDPCLDRRRFPRIVISGCLSFSPHPSHASERLIRAVGRSLFQGRYGNVVGPDQ